MCDSSTASFVQPLRQEPFAHLQSLADLTLRGYVRHFRLLETEDGLILQGQVHTYYAKQCAQHTVMALTDLPIAANQIRVVEPLPLIHDSNVNPSRVSVLS
jgi:hypothetical protein